MQQCYPERYWALPLETLGSKEHDGSKLVDPMHCLEDGKQVGQIEMAGTAVVGE